MSILATEQAAAIAGREGKATSNDGKIDFKISPPGSKGDGTNPEQLFAAGYAACFGQAIKQIAKDFDIDIKDENVEVDITIKLHKEDEKGLFLSAQLNADIPGASQEDAEKLVAKAHETCPYSKAIRGNVDVTLQASGQEIKQAA